LSYAELGDVDPDDFAQFKLANQRTLPIASPDTKFGGWAAWVQGRASTSPLLFQVASDIKVSELTFGDGGTLYATLGPEGVELMTQGG
jgi:hypothetical protein